MWRSNTLKAGVLSLLALSLVLMVPGASEAQRRGGRGGGGGGGRSGGNWNGGSWNGGNWNNGWNRGGWGGVSIGIGTPFYGGYYGGYGNRLGYGYNYPYYGNYGYSNGYYDGSYTYSQPYYDSSTYSQPAYANGQTSFYSGNMTAPNSAGFTVRVPDPNAEVWFQNYRTQQTGPVRQFQSERLDPNSNYTFQVRARWMQNGQTMDQTRQVPARAGQNYMVDFSSESVPAAPSNRSTSVEPVSQ